MDPAELDKEIEELETRVERLRALYEQYFLGIEKIEPLVPRKDVERRIWRLRREQIRNTGKRFRLQTIIQRYNTFQQYWMRICREIEAGTYTRHLARAKKIMADAEPLTIAARKRKRAHQRALDRHEREEETKRDRADAAARELEDLSSLLDQPGALDSAMAAVDQLLGSPEGGAQSAPPSPARTVPSRRPRRSRGGPLDNLDLELDVIEGKLQPSQAPPPQPRAPGPARPPIAPLPSRPVPPPAAARPSPGARPGPRPPAPLPGRPGHPGPPGQPAGGARGQGPAVGLPRAPGPAPRPGPPGPGRPPPGPVGPRPPGPRGPGPMPGTPAPNPGGPPSRSPAPRPVTPPRETRPRAPTTAAGPHPFSGRRSDSSGSLTDNRVHELHTKLTALKRQTNDQSSVSVEGLRKSLLNAEAKLRSKHGAHRKVDFDVVIKDGKAVVKPVVK